MLHLSCCSQLFLGEAKIYLMVRFIERIYNVVFSHHLEHLGINFCHIKYTIWFKWLSTMSSVGSILSRTPCLSRHITHVLKWRVRNANYSTRFWRMCGRWWPKWRVRAVFYWKNICSRSLVSYTHQRKVAKLIGSVKSGAKESRQCKGTTQQPLSYRTENYRAKYNTPNRTLSLQLRTMPSSCCLCQIVKKVGYSTTKAVCSLYVLTGGGWNYPRTLVCQSCAQTTLPLH